MLKPQTNFYLRHGWREVYHRKRFSFFFVLNLSIGLVGLLIISAFKAGIEEFLDLNLRQQMTSDLVISSHFAFDEQAQEIIDQTLTTDDKRSFKMTLRAMAVSLDEERNQLIDLHVIDDSYPLIGTVLLKERGLVRPELYAEFKSEPVIWISQGLATTLDLTIGEQLLIGSANYVVQDIVEKEPLSFSTGLAPRVYVSHDQIGPSELILPTSHVHYRLNVLLQDNSQAANLKNELENPVYQQLHRRRSAAGENF